jgi:hypothetical protein
MEIIQKNKERIQYKWSPTLGTFQSSPEEIWGVVPYVDDTLPTVFCGLYSLNDFMNLWKHKGKRYIWWCGTDITRFINGYWLDEIGSIKISARPLAVWIAKNCESWVENEVEATALRKFGIESHVCPSFLGDLNDFKVNFTQSDHPKVYASVSGDDFTLYGWDKIGPLAGKNPDIDFHLYGNTVPYFNDSVRNPQWWPNIFEHGRIPKEQFNEEIKTMQGGLRLLPFDGFSEILAKSILMGQYPVSEIPYPHVLKPEEIGIIKDKKTPNYEGREWFMDNLNRYPWNQNI